MPVGTNPRNGNNCPRDAKTNGDEESSNSDDGSSMCEGDDYNGECMLESEQIHFSINSRAAGHYSTI